MQLHISLSNSENHNFFSHVDNINYNYMNYLICFSEIIRTDLFGHTIGFSGIILIYGHTIYGSVPPHDRVAYEFHSYLARRFLAAR